MSIINGLHGAPGEIRTPDPLVRSYAFTPYKSIGCAILCRKTYIFTLYLSIVYRCFVGKIKGNLL